MKRPFRVPAPVLVLMSISSVQFGSAIARTLFDDLGAAGITLLRVGIAALIFALVFRPKLRTWSAEAWRAAALLGVPHRPVPGSRRSASLASRPPRPAVPPGRFAVIEHAPW